MSFAGLDQLNTTFLRVFDLSMERPSLILVIECALKLSALLQRPIVGSNFENWKGPYFRSQQIPVDGWGNPYNYNSDGTRYIILSLGADGKSGGVGVNADVSAIGKLYWGKNVDN